MVQSSSSRGIFKFHSLVSPLKHSVADPALLIWYERPAATWNEALPLGNGRMGAMVFGGTQNERLQINEDTLWQGGPHDTTNPGAYQYLAELRESIFKGEPQKTEELAAKMMGNPPLLQPYQPLCDLRLHFFDHLKVKNYRRELDLDRATVSIRYRAGNVDFLREIFISHPDQIIVIHLSACKPGMLSFDVTMDSPQSGAKCSVAGKDSIRIMGQLEPRKESPPGSWIASWPHSGLRYQGLVSIRLEGGKSTASDAKPFMGPGTTKTPPRLVASAEVPKLQIRGADQVTLYFTAATNFKKHNDIGGDPAGKVGKILKFALSKSFKHIQKDHLADYQKLFRRVDLDLGASPASGKPIDWRIKRFGQGDPQLAALYYQFGRYLLISCSRQGTQPANLQGIWNQDLWPAWGSKMTTNINLEMNYWPAETGNLAECQEPIFDLIDDLRITGAKTAKAHYHCRGFTLHHNTDLWRAATPVDGSWGIWPMGAVWLCQHLWDHYEFSGDKNFLRKRAYPAMREAARFVLDFLVEAPPGTPFAGTLVTNPSHSPENRYFLENREIATLTYAATLDLELIGDLFAQCIKASQILGLDASLREEIPESTETVAAFPGRKPGPIAGMDRGLQRSRVGPPACFPPLRPLSQLPIYPRGGPGTRGRGEEKPRASWGRRNGMGQGLESQLVGPFGRWKPRLSYSPGAYFPMHLAQSF